MAINTPITDTFLITDAVKKAVKYEIEQEYDRNVKELTERLEKQKDIIVSGVLLNLMKHVKMETMGQELVVTIRKLDTPS